MCPSVHTIVLMSICIHSMPYAWVGVYMPLYAVTLCSLQNRLFPRIGRRIFAPRKRRMGLLGTRPKKNPKKMRGGERKQNCTFYGVNSMALKKNFKGKWKPTGTRLRHRVFLLGTSIYAHSLIFYLSLSLSLYLGTSPYRRFIRIREDFVRQTR